MKCIVCKGKAIVTKKSMDGIEYELWRCQSCNEEYLDMRQLKVLGKKHKKMRESKRAKFTRWGNSLGIRIPSSLASKLKIKPGTEADLIEEDGIIKIIPT